jgi:FkbM family methyltransferase
MMHSRSHNSFAETLLQRLVPFNSRWLYKVCKRYVDNYNGENNDHLESNGELRLLRELLPECNTVFDVGANAGEWAAFALQVNPQLNLHCFEPSQATYERLVARGFPQNVVCNNFGLSSSSAQAKLLLFDDGAGINSLYRREGLEDGFGLKTQQREELIHLETADRYCEQHGIRNVDFFKVDVEGHELEVFKGMTKLLEERRVKSVQFEYGGCNIDADVLLRAIFAFFKSFDYTLYKIYPKHLRRVIRYDQRLENFQYQNWVAMLDS